MIEHIELITNIQASSLMFVFLSYLIINFIGGELRDGNYYRIKVALLVTILLSSATLVISSLIVIWV